MARGVFGRLRSRKGSVNSSNKSETESTIATTSPDGGPPFDPLSKKSSDSQSSFSKQRNGQNRPNSPSNVSVASTDVNSVYSVNNNSHQQISNKSRKRISLTSSASSSSSKKQQQQPPPQEQRPLSKAQSARPAGRRQQHRRSSFGDASLTVTSSLTGTSSPIPSPKAKSARYINSRRSSRRQQKRPPDLSIEEEKKEIHSGDEHDDQHQPQHAAVNEEETEAEDDFFESPEFRNRVAQEAADLDKEGNTYFERGDYDQAFLSYERALKLKRASLQVDQDQKKPGSQDMLTETESQKASILASVATSINNMTYLRQRAGQASADETMAAYLKSLQIKREILGPNHLSVGKTLNNIGSVFYLKKEYVPALKAYENAHEIMAEQLGETHLDVGTVLSNIGDVHSAMQHRQEALEYYRRALDVRWAQLGRNDPKVVRLMEQTASLETGRQPRKKADDLSDSEDEEFAQEDRKRQQDFHEECQALQEELLEDIKFFDLVERTLAIELVKEKTKFMRTMRKARNNPTNFEFNMDDRSQHSDSSSMSVMSAPPDLDLDGTDSVDEAPEVLAFLKEIGAPPIKKSPARKPHHTRHASFAGAPRTPAKGASPKTKTPATASTKALTPGSTPRQKRSPRASNHAAASKTRSPAAKNQKSPSVRKAPSSSNRNVPRTPSKSRSSQNKMRKAASQRLASTTASGGGSFQHSQQKNGRIASSSSLQYNRSKSTMLTPDERRMALMSVKERVATLKSKRELGGSGDIDPEAVANARKEDRIHPKRRLYLNATRSATQKEAPPVK